MSTITCLPATRVLINNYNMDLQKMVDSINESTEKLRSNYHLTYGDLIEALESAPKGAKFDKRIKGIGSWRGSYIEIALYTDEGGYHVEKKEFNGYGSDFASNYKKWEKENVISGDKLPSNANELAKLLKSFIGFDFVGYKGGHFKIEEYKPLWLEQNISTYSNIAVVGIDEKLKLITKDLDVEG